MRTLDDKMLHRSRLAETAPLGINSGRQEIPLTRAQSDDGSSRAWRITFSRPSRVASAAPIVNGGENPYQPLYESSNYPFAAGIGIDAAYAPPKRSNPVNDFGDQAIDGSPFAVVAFGMEMASPDRLMGHWPAMGGTLIVVGSYVEVWAGFRGLNGGGLTPAQLASLGQFRCTIVPAEGAEQRDAGELSLSFVTNVWPYQAPTGNANMTTQRVMSSNPALGPTGGTGSLNTNPGALPWNDIIRSTSRATQYTTSVSVRTSDGNPTELRLDQWFNGGTNAWEPSPGNIGVHIDTAAPLALGTIAGLRAALIATGRVALVTAGVTPATNTFTIADSPVTFQHVQYLPLSLPARKGTQLAIPDFARRVKIIGATNATNEPGVAGPYGWVVPWLSFGDWPDLITLGLQIQWYNDAGTIVDIDRVGASADVNTVENGKWLAVPAAATICQVYMADPAITVPQVIACHWRIAP